MAGAWLNEVGIAVDQSNFYNCSARNVEEPRAGLDDKRAGIWKKIERTGDREGEEREEGDAKKDGRARNMKEARRGNP